MISLFFLGLRNAACGGGVDSRPWWHAGTSDLLSVACGAIGLLSKMRVVVTPLQPSDAVSELIVSRLLESIVELVSNLFDSVLLVSVFWTLGVAKGQINSRSCQSSSSSSEVSRIIVGLHFLLYLAKTGYILRPSIKISLETLKVSFTIFESVLLSYRCY